jgi:replicative DNA helicase
MKNPEPTHLPSNFLVEQAVLNLLLVNSSLAKDAIVGLKSETFHFKTHRIIYDTIIELHEKNSIANTTLIVTSLTNKDLLKDIGGINKIIDIMNEFEDFSDLPAFIAELNNKYLRRIIVETGKKIIGWGYETSEDLEKILENIEDSLSSLNQEQLAQDAYSAEEIMNDVYCDIKAKRKKIGGISLGLNSSFKDLDSIIQGFQKSDLIIVAGRPSMGKTAFSLNLGKNIVEKYSVPLLIFSLEMSRQQIMYRFISTDSNINASRLKSAKMSILDWQNLNTSMKKISLLPIFIDDNPNVTLTHIRSRLKKVFTKTVVNGLVIIDYLQLMKMSSKLENRVQEISHITRSLKILAKEFQVPIMVLSQLSRNVESRTNRRPMLSDLRESGCIANNEEFLSKNEASSTKILKIKSWNQDSLVNTKLVNFDFKGVKPTFLIEFKYGKTICLTSNHRILSKDGWIRASQIQKDTEIYCLLKTKNKSLVKYNYSKIENITYQGIKEVYDKTIVGFHNYLSKDIVLHNSIEQDADIVIMIYREEYYKENTAEEQITEIIVAKHRNGPIGTAKLLFKPSVTSFVNL